jgi:hypothetical protein
MADQHQGHHGEMEVPERTTAQGSLEHTAPGEYQPDGFDPRSLIPWGIGLAIGTFASMALMIVEFHFLRQAHTEADKRVPEMMAQPAQKPPDPRLLPNAADVNAKSVRLQPILEPPQIREAIEAKENRELQTLGLYLLEEGVHRIPSHIVTRLAGGHGGTEEAPAEQMPSRSSGGLQTENRLK